MVAFTMLCGYFLTDVMSPLKTMLEKELLWDSLDYGIFTSAYGWFNVFAFMLIIGGIILDKMGVRFTGMGACLLMVLGCGLKYYAISTTFAEGSTLLGMKTQVGLAALGCAAYSCFAAADTDPHFMMATRYRSSVMFMSSSAWFAVVTVL